MNDYERIAKAIEYIEANYRNQPGLEEIAKEVYLSPFHFQRLFKEWAGVSPKKFLQYISLQHAKTLLRQHVSLAEASYETGFSGTSRLHDLFITIEGMTPGEYKTGGQGLTIEYSFANIPFGEIIIASTAKGICNLFFADDRKIALNELIRQWPNAVIKENKNEKQENILSFFNNDWNSLQKIKLHLKGTDFQLKVWEALLKIPFGRLSAYSSVAEIINKPAASRAVGSAIADNPVAFLIPCHRVIKSTGITGDYHWGSIRKKAIIGWESAKIFGEEQNSK
jgi:AraC family transcriptional regulator, regulatory protein of adaptative response / methylated-DNA-[protein]-cysteine methyltransferase